MASDRKIRLGTIGDAAPGSGAVNLYEPPGGLCMSWGGWRFFAHDPDGCLVEVEEPRAPDRA
jgi:hypothetical protein